MHCTVPNIKADHMTQEDEIYRQYLEANGFDTSKMGMKPLLKADTLETLDREERKVHRADSDEKVQ